MNIMKRLITGWTLAAMLSVPLLLAGDTQSPKAKGQSRYKAKAACCEKAKVDADQAKAGCPLAKARANCATKAVTGNKPACCPEPDCCDKKTACNMQAVGEKKAACDQASAKASASKGACPFAKVDKATKK
jgi:hypothetical protein